MPMGDFYKRRCSSGTEFEVVMLRAEEQAVAKRDLRALGVQVRDEATMGDFTIHIDDPMDWAKVGSVVFGEIFADDDPVPAAGPTSATGSTPSVSA